MYQIIAETNSYFLCLDTKYVNLVNKEIVFSKNDIIIIISERYISSIRSYLSKLLHFLQQIIAANSFYIVCLDTKFVNYRNKENIFKNDVILINLTESHKSRLPQATTTIAG